MPLAQLNVVLPIGISFYTFQSMSYVIDIYRKDIKPTRELHRVRGVRLVLPAPGRRADHAADDAAAAGASPRRFNLQQFYQGSYLIFWGLTKKVVVADNLATIVNDLFGRCETIDGGLALLAIYAFAFQIYCDFSGYTDAARGIAKCLGLRAGAQLQPALLRRQPAGLLGALAHQPLDLAPRLPLHPARRQPRRHG